MATPHVAGIAALLKAFNPLLTNLDIADILTIAVEDIDDAGWDKDTGYGRVNAHTALLIASVWPEIIDSDPPNRAIDARMPTDSLALQSFGWDSIEVFSTPDVVAGLGIESISVEQRAHVCSGSKDPCSATPDCPISQACVPATDFEAAAQVDSIVPVDAERATIILDKPINLFAWTRIRVGENSLIRLAYLPGDVNGNSIADEDDLTVLVDELEAGETTLPEWSVDIDRSTMFTPLDLLTCLDLFNGADAYQRFLDEQLEPGIE